ncbi:MAG TPA: hypothetical protein VFD39_05860 [Trueperaceae bacterium]|nr:hypothetical protein [Trueperaceae bacterium]
MTRRTVRLTTLIASALLVLAACTTPNTAPEVSITSPTDAAVIALPGTVVLAATATDAQDGDLSDAVVWMSDVDGALTPAAGGEVTLSAGTHTITATVTDAAALAGTDSVTVSVNAATHLVSEGTTLHLMGVVDNELLEVDSAGLPAAGLLDEHQIFNVIAHPTEDWLFVASMNSCALDDDACWGNGRIDRFVVAGNSITYDGLAFSYDETTTAQCALEPVDPTVMPGQVGFCALNGMAFSSDGSRLYVDDDDFDVLQVFSVDANGDLTFIAEGASTDAHGLAIDATDTYVYNGSEVIEVTNDAPTTVFNGLGGNATTLLDVGGTASLITTTNTDTIALFGLTDPLNPALIDDHLLATNQARDLAFTADLSRIITPGQKTVNSLSFDGTVFALDDTYTSTATPDTQFRAVGLNADATWVLAAWFQIDAADTSGGLDLFSVAADGTLALLDSVGYINEARVVYTLP